jgi:DNA-binding Lrp family transcriptional regulator
MQHKLDSFDRRLLTIVQRDADLTSDQLAERIGLSASAIQRRLKRLRATGVISSVVAIVEPEKVGRLSFFIVGLEIERERPELLTRLRAWLAAEDAIQQVFYVTGNSDFILVVTAPDVASYDELMSRLIAENPNVRRFTTNVALGVHKRRLTIPIGAEREK